MPRQSRKEDQAKGIPVHPVLIPEKGKKPSDIVEIPKVTRHHKALKDRLLKRCLRVGWLSGEMFLSSSF